MARCKIIVIQDGALRVSLVGSSGMISVGFPGNFRPFYLQTYVEDAASGHDTDKDRRSLCVTPHEPNKR